MSCVVSHNWSWEDLIASKHLMVTGRWREGTQTLSATRPVSLWCFGDSEGEGHSAKEGMWVGRAQMRGEATMPAGEMPIKAARI